MEHEEKEDLEEENEEETETRNSTGGEEIVKAKKMTKQQN